MSFNNNTVDATRGAFSIANLQKIQPVSDSGRHKQDDPKQKRRKRSDQFEIEEDVDTTVYTLDGHVEGDEHGIRIDISA
jgi:hypothetical protein